jgi:PD-(D/E)XK nuclease superfamily
MGFKPLVPADELDFGTAWHKALEVYYNPDNPRDAIGALQAFNQLVQQQDIVARDYGIDFELDTLKQLGEGMLKYYFEWAAIYDDFESVAVEREFEVPILHPNGNPVVYTFCPCRNANEPPGEPHEWVFQGRVDGIRRRNDGTYWIAEEKTAKTESDWSWHVMEPQTLRYMWALKHSLGIDFHGVIRTEALKRFPTPPAKLKSGRLSVDRRQATTTKQLMLAIAKNGEQLEDREEYIEYLRFLQSPAAPTFVRREYVDFTPEMMEIAGQNLYRVASRMISTPDKELLPNVTFMCKRCMFFGPCLGKQSGDDFMYTLKTQFRKEARKS